MTSPPRTLVRGKYRADSAHRETPSLPSGPMTISGKARGPRRSFHGPCQYPRYQSVKLCGLGWKTGPPMSPRVLRLGHFSPRRFSGRDPTSIFFGRLRAISSKLVPVTGIDQSQDKPPYIKDVRCLVRSILQQTVRGDVTYVRPHGSAI
jgi:hypothetical protein